MAARSLRQALLSTEIDVDRRACKRGIMAKEAATGELAEQMAVSTLPGALNVEPQSRMGRLRSKFGGVASDSGKKTSSSDEEDAPRSELEQIDPLSYWQLYT